MKKITTLFAIVIFTSCSIQHYPLKGQYLTPPFQITSTNSKDVVWDKIIDLFSQKGLPIKIIDRSSGLIISEKSALLTSYEDPKTSKIKNASAWIVVPTFKNPATYRIEPVAYTVKGEWNIRIKDIEGKTSINVNIVNLKQDVPSVRGMTSEVSATDARSTGVFESMIADLVK